MNIQIIEDCSPYYIRFTHDGADAVVGLCREYQSRADIPSDKKFVHHKLPRPDAIEVLKHVPKSEELKLFKDRVSLFISKPGLYYRPHRDGLSLKVGINYGVSILDDRCTTSWYDHATFAGRPIDTLGGRSREIADFRFGLEYERTPKLMSMIARPGEAVLFNTDLYHDFNNDSNNIRTVLTLRSAFGERLDFSAAAKILFGEL